MRARTVGVETMRTRACVVSGDRVVVTAWKRSAVDNCVVATDGLTTGWVGDGVVIHFERIGRIFSASHYFS